MNNQATAQRKLRLHALWLGFGVAMVATVITVSLVPDPPKPLTFHHADKLEHLTSYALLMGWFSQIYFSARARIALALSFVAMGVGLEVIQGLGGHRRFDWYDAAANSAGVTLAWLLTRPPLNGVLNWIERRFLAGSR